MTRMNEVSKESAINRLAVMSLIAAALCGCELNWDEGPHACMVHEDCAEDRGCIAGTCQWIDRFDLELQGDSASTRVGRPIVIDVLANDTLPGPATTDLITASDQIEQLSAGVYRFTPTADLGELNFGYRIVLGRNVVYTRVFYISVYENFRPEAVDADARTLFDQPIAIQLAATDANFPNENPLLFTVLDAPAHGSLSGEPPILVYTPDPGYFGPDAFRFVASDGDLESEPATVTLTVDCAAPGADAGLTDWDTPLVLDVLANDNEPAASVVSVSQPQMGSVSITAEGAIEYQPARLFLGNDSFTYRLGREDGCTAEAEVVVSVDWPVWVAGQGAAAESRAPAVSADGAFVAFSSEDANMVAGDGNGVMDVFLWEVATNTVERVSVATGGTEANGASFDAHVSGDGRYVVFISQATNLGGSASGLGDVYLHDRQTGTTQLVNVAEGAVAADFESSSPKVSDDGTLVGFASVATNLVPADTNGVRDIFLRDLQAGTTERVNLAGDGTQANGPSGRHLTMSADGNRFGFASAAPNLGSNADALTDAMVRDRALGTTTLIGFTASRAVLAADGRFVAFRQSATVEVLDLDGGTAVSVPLSEHFALSSGGRYFVYETLNTGLSIIDLVTGEKTKYLCRYEDGSASDTCAAPAISSDGRFVAFESTKALVSNLTAGARRVFAARHLLAP